ncbi:hypothetical protein BJ878DRAFT_580991 [Calycina marina]|uniref:CBM1 domain-containing protein n=1 Tax=Calycina marina TaxID=1763456 RepID=A0A9P7Z833_9HELO|nr:hypothetical protein BJ878DRAFT_580991 [Calycina marina]
MPVCDIGGGQSWSGATTCVTGFVCTYFNQYYSQCLPETAPSKPTTTGRSPSTPFSTAYPGTILQSGYYWIRAVEAPNFHMYLKISPQYVSDTAILNSYTTAGQFQVVSGQLWELISGGLLYANVIPSSATDKLAVTFKSTQNAYGKFSWSGVALQWSVPTITRPNLSAWLVCANQQLFVNLGSHGYQPPARCSDGTIHYSDSVANSKQKKRDTTKDMKNE